MRWAVAKKQEGFTVVEIMVVVAIIALLFALGTINLGNTQTTTSLSSAVSGLVADIKSQQMLAMSGDQGSVTSQQPQGLYVQSGTYTLFAGTTYNSGDTNNFTVNPGQGISLSTTFPSSTVLFNKGTGEVSGYSATTNKITLTFNGTSKTVTIDRFGAVTVN